MFLLSERVSARVILRTVPGTPNNGTLDPSAPPSLNTRIAHNELAFGRHNHAINADCFQDTCAESVIEFNHIHDVGRQDETGLCDGGGIHGERTGSTDSHSC